MSTFKFSSVDGNVGIGLTNPGVKLQVAGSVQLGINTGDYQRMQLGGGNSSGFMYGCFAKYGDAVHMGYNFYNNNSANVIPNTGGATSRLTMGYGSISMYTGGVNAEPTNLGVCQISNGNVGIGGTSPRATCDVYGFAQAQKITTCAEISNSTARPAVGTSVINGEIHSYGGVGGSPLGAGADDGFLRLSAGGGTRVNTKSYIDLSGYSSVTERNVNIVLGTSGTERMRIELGGNVGIGTATATQKLDVAGTVKATAFVGDGSGLTGISGSTTGQLMYVTSGGLRVANQRLVVDGDLIVGGNIISDTNTAQYTGGSTLPVTISANSVGTSNLIDGAVTPAKLNLQTGNVGIGTATPTQLLSIGANGAGFPEPSGAAPMYAARAWVVFDGTIAGANPATMTINAGANVSSVTRTETGKYTITFTTPMPHAYYAIAGSTNTAVLGPNAAAASTASTAYVVTLTPGVGYTNNARVSAVFFAWLGSWSYMIGLTVSNETSYRLVHYTSNAGGYLSGANELFVGGGGGVTLDGVLDRVRVTTSAGTPTFTSGTVNIMYEG